MLFVVVLAEIIIFGFVPLFDNILCAIIFIVEFLFRRIIIGF